MGVAPRTSSWYQQPRPSQAWAPPLPPLPLQIWFLGAEMKNQSSISQKGAEGHRGVASPVRAGGLGLTCGDYATAGKQSHNRFWWDSVGQNRSRTVSEPVQNLSRTGSELVQPGVTDRSSEKENQTDKFSEGRGHQSRLNWTSDGLQKLWADGSGPIWGISVSTQNPDLTSPSCVLIAS